MEYALDPISIVVWNGSNASKARDKIQKGDKEIGGIGKDDWFDSKQCVFARSKIEDANEQLDKPVESNIGADTRHHARLWTSKDSVYKTFTIMTPHYEIPSSIIGHDVLSWHKARTEFIRALRHIGCEVKMKTAFALTGRRTKRDFQGIPYDGNIFTVNVKTCDNKPQNQGGSQNNGGSNTEKFRKKLLKKVKENINDWIVKLRNRKLIVNEMAKWGKQAASDFIDSHWGDFWWKLAMMAYCTIENPGNDLNCTKKGFVKKVIKRVVDKMAKDLKKYINDRIQDLKRYKQDKLQAVREKNYIDKDVVRDFSWTVDSTASKKANLDYIDKRLKFSAIIIDLIRNKKKK